jgi:hypothetical protein
MNKFTLKRVDGTSVELWENSLDIPVEAAHLTSTQYDCDGSEICNCALCSHIRMAKINAEDTEVVIAALKSARARA